MLRYWWYRHVRYRDLFEKDNRVDDFAEIYMSADLDRMKAKGDRLREQVRLTRSNRLQWSNERDKLEKQGGLLQDGEFHTLAAKYRNLVFVLTLIALAESGLNFFTAIIAIPAVGFLAGGIGTILRLAAAVVVTVLGILGAEFFLDEVLPNRKYASTEQHARNWARAFLWGVVLFGTEFMIWHFGLLRARDIGAGNIDPDIKYSIVILSMIVPVVGGGIAWELGNIRDAYKNRLLFDKLTKRIGRADTTIERLNEKENGFLQQETNDWWLTFNRLKSFKEYYNHRVGMDTAPLSPQRVYASEYATFYTEALARYNQHKEKQDALGRLKLDSGSYGVVGRKVGQDNSSQDNAD